MRGTKSRSATGPMIVLASIICGLVTASLNHFDSGLTLASCFGFWLLFSSLYYGITALLPRGRR